VPAHDAGKHHGHRGHGGGDDPGRLIRWPGRYDLLLAVVLAGRGPRLRSHLADILELRPGQHVLDMGCGTGTLALSLVKRVRPGGRVTGVDAAPEMLAVARAKAARRCLPASFQYAVGQALPFPDAAFDAAVSSLVLHHLPEAVRSAAVAELVRVVRPGGRLVLADFQPPAGRLAGTLARHALGHAMAASDLGAVLELATAAGVQQPRLDPTPVGWLGVVYGRIPPAGHL
jgi:ubiquinone/menaquinone biosynthesis C-methylase UbiE